MSAAAHMPPCSRTTIGAGPVRPAPQEQEDER
jgi:hypothetical protein